MEKKALALFGTAPYASTPTATTVKSEAKIQNSSTTESEHNAEVESMLQEVAFDEVEPENHIIVRKRSISAENNTPHTPKNIKIEQRKLQQPVINKKTIIFDFDASDENLDDIIVEDELGGKTSTQKISRCEEQIRNIEPNISPKKISLSGALPHAATSDSAFASSIAYQLKRIADVKEEKLMFEIAKYKYNNPGFKYEYTGTAESSDEPQEDVLVNVYSEEHY